MPSFVLEFYPSLAGTMVQNEQTAHKPSGHAPQSGSVFPLHPTHSEANTLYSGKGQTAPFPGEHGKRSGCSSPGSALWGNTGEAGAACKPQVLQAPLCAEDEASRSCVSALISQWKRAVCQRVSLLAPLRKKKKVRLDVQSDFALTTELSHNRMSSLL